jgi:hypothetical protein
MAWPTSAFRPARPKQGNSPVLHRRAAHRPNPADQRRVAGEGGAKEQAPEVRVLIWNIGSGGAHHGGLTTATQVGGGEPAMAGRRRGRERQLGVRGAAVSSGRGHCSDGGARRWLEVALNRRAPSATECGGRLGALTVACGGRWLSGRLGMAQRRTRVVHGGRHFSAWSRGVRRRGSRGARREQSRVGSVRRLSWEEER